MFCKCACCPMKLLCMISDEKFCKQKEMAMEMEEILRVAKNIAKAVVAVIEIFEQEGFQMGIIRIGIVTCKVVGNVISIVSALKHQHGNKNVCRASAKKADAIYDKIYPIMQCCIFEERLVDSMKSGFMEVYDMTKYLYGDFSGDGSCSFSRKRW